MPRPKTGNASGDNSQQTPTQEPPTPPDPMVDLDQFLNLPPGQNVSQPAAPSGRVEMPEADRVAIVGIFADDSGSMRSLREAVIDGLKLSVEAFRGAKGSDFYLDIRGFQMKFFAGLLKDVKDDSFNPYSPTYDSTPLVTHTMSHLRELHTKAEQYRAMGIPTTVALLIITDGLPNSEEARPESFPAEIESGDYIVGMGVAHPGNDSAVNAYENLFREMGATKTVTPRSAAPEVRHAINQFSQSVASIAAA